MRNPIILILLLLMSLSSWAQMTKVVVPPTPRSLNFAGESVPMNNWEVAERFDRELITNCYLHGKTMHILKLTKRYEKRIKSKLKQNGIPEDFFYLCVAESALMNQVSKAGAAGFWQFMSATGRHYGLEVNSYVDERFNWELSTQAACQYLKDAYRKFGNWTNAAASYNMGMGGLNSRISKQGVRSFYDLDLPEETERYIFRILALKTIMQNPSLYGYEVPENDKYPIIPSRSETVTYGISDLASWARQKGTNLYMLKVMNPWLRSTYLTNNSGKRYIIDLPR